LLAHYEIEFLVDVLILQGNSEPLIVDAAPPRGSSSFHVDFENVHDTGLHFHPIHRVLFGVNAADLAE